MDDEYLQTGQKERACGWFEKSITLTRANDSDNVDLRHLWAEAAERLELPGPPADC